MKKTTLLLIPILFLCSNLFSQEETERKWAVKAYVNGDFYSNKTITLQANGNVETQFYSDRNIGEISPAISYTKGIFAQELELVHLKIRRVDYLNLVEPFGQNLVFPTSGEVNRKSEIELRYLASAVFRPFKSKKVSLGIGGSIRPYFHRSKSIPNTSADFPLTRNYLGTTISAVPQIEYDFYKRFFINLSSPFEIFDISLDSYKSKTPLINTDAKDVQAEFLPKRYHLRMGLGVRF